MAENIDVFKNINLKDLSSNSLKSLEEIVKFIPPKAELRKDIIREILKKKRKVKK